MSNESSRKARELRSAASAARGRRNFLAGALSVGAASALARSAFADPLKTAPGTAADHVPARGPTPPIAADKKLVPLAADPKAPVPTESASGLALPALPYPQSALEPYITANTVSLHYGKHHRTYYEKVNAAVQGTPLSGKPLEHIVKESAKGGKDRQKLFNNAAQAWNHDLYWQSIKPGGGGEPSGELRKRIDKDFGSYDAWKSQFITIATEHFSNGWVWLVLDKNKLKIVDTHDADTPLVRGQKPLLVSDVWEHAYYLDYKNVRKDYVTAFVEHLINWDFVAKNLG